ncbi:MAG TPA: hypothetical protein VFQ63_02875 [Patescibacteria group bacterium]|nr:hypothetical protein [Patescibacteria group bacterium]
MAGSEFGQRFLGATEQAGGVLLDGLSVVVNPTPLEAPANEVIKVLDSVGSGNLTTMIETTAKAPIELINLLAHAGATGLAAAILLAGGVYLIGNGRVRGHDARRAAGRS